MRSLPSQKNEEKAEAVYQIHRREGWKGGQSWRDEQSLPQDGLLYQKGESYPGVNAENGPYSSSDQDI